MAARFPLRRLVVTVTLVGLLWWAARHAPLPAILGSLSRLNLWQLAALLLANSAVVSLITLRWWLIVRAEAPRVPFRPLLAARLSAFALSYLTMGPQVGGEPLQVMHLRARHSLSLVRAVSSVMLDKLLEFLGNFLLLAIGAVAVARLGFFPAAARSMAFWLALCGLFAIPPLYISVLRSGRRPLRAILGCIVRSHARTHWFRVVVASEHMAATFLRRHARSLVAALGASLAAWFGMAAEYMLMLRFLGIDLDLWQSLSSLAASLLAFLMPLPAGLGALEASQVAVLGTFGIPPAAALSLTLLLRARDLLNVTAGVLLSHGAIRSRR